MQNKVLKILMDNKGYISGQAISTQLGVSRQTVWKAVCSLREKGYEINSVTNKGYILVSEPNHLDEFAIKKYLHSNIIGREILVLDTIGSTNDYLKKLGGEGCTNGTVAASREQTKGKGRLGRGWVSKKDDCLSFSVLLRPKMAPNEISVITPLAGLAVCKAIRYFTGLDCKIKWPNDIVAGNKKLVGILSEISAEFGAVEYVVTGIGINVEQCSFPKEIADKATSLLIETGIHFNKNKFLACVLEHLEDEFVKNDLRFTHSALAEYSDLCITLDRRITFTRCGNKLEATAVEIDKNGELIAELDDKTRLSINSGEVIVQGIY